MTLSESPREVDGDNFGFDGGFETDPGVLFKGLDFLRVLDEFLASHCFTRKEGFAENACKMINYYKMITDDLN